MRMWRSYLAPLAFELLAFDQLAVFNPHIAPRSTLDCLSEILILIDGTQSEIAKLVLHSLSR